MKTVLIAFLLSTAFVMAQDKPATPSPDNSAAPKGQVTVQGCVTRQNGDYVLIKQDPGNTYELQAHGKLKLHSYLGQRVEVTGKESPSLSTSSDAIARMGSASPVTITVSSIRAIDKECPLR
jgi:hypothetical protein